MRLWRQEQGNRDSKQEGRKEEVAVGEKKKNKWDICTCVGIILFPKVVDFDFRYSKKKKAFT